MSHGLRHVEVIYCDDIRDEVGNKVSYMGVYSGELLVPSVPTLLAKLCISVKVITDVKDPFELLEVRILKGDEQSELLSTGQIGPPPESQNVVNGGTMLTAQLAFVLAPFQIDGETILRVRATTEREELRGQALRIRTLQQVPVKSKA